MTDLPNLIVIAGVLFLAGTVKGVVGLGLPTVSLALLTPALGLHDAIAAMLLPSFLTNLQQALTGGGITALLKRFWPFLAAVVLGTIATSGAVALIDTVVLVTVLGASITLYAALGLLTPPWPHPGRHEAWLGPVSGALTGLLTGMTGSFVIPSVPYLQALGLGRDRLVQMMGATFTAATLALAAGLGSWGVLDGTALALAAVVGVPPAFIGMEVGRRLRGRLSERAFRRALFTALLLLGIWMIARELASVAA
ncbi:MAG: sulfite exporter TauE/SafE family protein [Thalassobaculaceae bacterium]|nr:sulfite exporter TauE/SafE family protein [Thalassobaculaceae bacterium]